MTKIIGVVGVKMIGNVKSDNNVLTLSNNRIFISHISKVFVHHICKSMIIYILNLWEIFIFIMIHQYYLNHRITYGHLHSVTHLIQLIVLIVMNRRKLSRHYGNFHYMNGSIPMVISLFYKFFSNKKRNTRVIKIFH